MKMKKVVTIAAGVMMSMALFAGCSSPQPSATATPTPKPSASIAATPTPEVNPTPEITIPPAESAVPSPEVSPSLAPEESLPPEPTPIPDTEYSKAMKEAIHKVVSEYEIKTDGSEESYVDGMLPGRLLEKLPEGLTMLPPDTLDETLIEDGVVMQAMMNVRSDLVYVVRAKDEDSAKEMEKQFKKIQEGQVEIWKQYLADQYEKVQNTIIKRDGKDVYYICADTPEDIEKAVKEVNAKIK